MRSFDDEMEVRGQQRQRYFEDPNYRKWSDIQSNSTLNPYDATPDHDFFHLLFVRNMRQPTKFTH